MSRASGTSSYAIHILVTLRRILGKIYTGTKHAAYVGVPLIKALVGDCIDERRSCAGDTKMEIYYTEY